MEKTADGLVKYAKAQLGLPYWYGTFGLTASETLYKSKRVQYPAYYASWNDFPSQYGKRVHDCVGLIKGYLWSETPTSTPKYNSSQDVSANGMRNVCAEKGDIASMPDEAGVLVFMDGHVGVYIGGGEVIEARGHEFGVVKTKLNARPWKWWGRCPWIGYGAASAAAEEDTPVNGIHIKKLTVKKGTWNVRRLPTAASPSLTVVKGGSDIGIADGWLYVPSLGGFISVNAVV